MTARELQIVALVVDGLSNREIGERLAISARTVQSHLAATMRKLQANTRTQVAVAALRAGLVAIDGPSIAEPGAVRSDGSGPSPGRESGAVVGPDAVDASSEGSAPVSRWACQLSVRAAPGERSG